MPRTTKTLTATATKTPARARPTQKLTTVNKGGPVGVTGININHSSGKIEDDKAENESQDVDLIKKTLRDIMGDNQAPAAAKAQAARTLAEMVGALGRHAPPPADPGKSITAMTRADLEAELAAMHGP